jgi:hypothetical protein
LTGHYSHVSPEEQTPNKKPYKINKKLEFDPTRIPGKLQDSDPPVDAVLDVNGDVVAHMRKYFLCTDTGNEMNVTYHKIDPTKTVLTFSGMNLNKNRIQYIIPSYEITGHKNSSFNNFFDYATHKNYFVENETRPGLNDSNGLPFKLGTEYIINQNNKLICVFYGISKARGDGNYFLYFYNIDYYNRYNYYRIKYFTKKQVKMNVNTVKYTIPPAPVVLDTSGQPLIKNNKYFVNSNFDEKCTFIGYKYVKSGNYDVSFKMNTGSFTLPVRVGYTYQPVPNPGAAASMSHTPSTSKDSF